MAITFAIIAPDEREGGRQGATSGTMLLPAGGGNTILSRPSRLQLPSYLFFVPSRRLTASLVTTGDISGT